MSLFASKNNIPFLDPDILDSKFKDKLKKMKPDLFLVCAYGKILSDDFIKIPTYGTLNIHPSLLPQYRGPSPVQNTIINLDDDSGYTIIKMDKGIDTGDILFISEPISLRKNEKYLDLLNISLLPSSKFLTMLILFEAAAAIAGIIDVVNMNPGANDLINSIMVSSPVIYPPN